MSDCPFLERRLRELGLQVDEPVTTQVIEQLLRKDVRRMNLMATAISARDAYIKLLGDECGKLAVAAAVHGWRSSEETVKAGEEARARIAAADAELES